jgi:ATP-dependent Clp protease protease subunit
LKLSKNEHPDLVPVPDFVHKANAERALAQAEQARADTGKTIVETRSAEAYALESEYIAREREISLAREEYKRARELASDEFHHVYRFIGAVNDGSVKECINQLQTWDRMEPDCSITLLFHSPGGDVVAGLALWDFLIELKGTHQLTTVARGYAASMAGILLQAGHKRAMGAESWLLIHEASFGVAGSMGEVEDRVEWIKKVQGRILQIFADRSNLTKASIKRRWHRKDWWLSSDEALKHGFIDEIA